MGITLSQIAANTAQVSFEVTLTAEDGSTHSESVTVVYYPGRVTEKAIAQLQGFAALTAESVVSGFSAFNVTLAHLIKSWDVYEDAEQTQMFPLDPVRLAELPFVFRVQVITAIMSDLRPEAMAPVGANHLN